MAMHRINPRGRVRSLASLLAETRLRNEQHLEATRAAEKFLKQNPDFVAKLKTFLSIFRKSGMYPGDYLP
jgi:hypothetical protein